MSMSPPTLGLFDRSHDEQRALSLLAGTDHGRVATSMRALPFLAAARHILVADRLLLRMHRGHGYHQACLGSVVAYGADNLGHREPGSTEWSVQLVGLCTAVQPTAAELRLFGPLPHRVDGQSYDPVYLRIEPQLVTLHESDPAGPAV
ncbi:pyridoxamine 5'-phosphate oxidase family protein [Streptomyces sp. NPDC049906]|uniref:pyridoxamine 5'-phosphate oxidase family protein n=1 Tax=Streptomyces sp. NPDC049906 TaxID=3155656 RepID=UPI0034172D34